MSIRKLRTEHIEANALVENKVTQCTDNAELGIYDTYVPAFGVGLTSDQLLYCGMVTGKKVMHGVKEPSECDFLPNESFVIAPDHPVEIDFPIACPENPTTCLAIEIDKAKVKSVADRMNYETPIDASYGEWRYEHRSVHAEHNESTQALLNRLVGLFDENDPDREFLLDLGINELIARLLRHQVSEFILDHSGANPEANGLNAVLKHIQNHLTEPLDVDLLCRIACMSRSKFFSTFRQHLGCAPGHFLQQQRLKKAAELLKKNRTVTQVTFDTGFQSMSHFSRSFKTWFGESPQSYQARKRSH